MLAYVSELRVVRVGIEESDADPPKKETGQAYSFLYIFLLFGFPFSRIRELSHHAEGVAIH